MTAIATSPSIPEYQLPADFDYLKSRKNKEVSERAQAILNLDIQYLENFIHQTAAYKIIATALLAIITFPILLPVIITFLVTRYLGARDQAYCDVVQAMTTRRIEILKSTIEVAQTNEFRFCFNEGEHALPDRLKKHLLKYVNTIDYPFMRKAIIADIANHLNNESIDNRNKWEKLISVDLFENKSINQRLGNNLLHATIQMNSEKEKKFDYIEPPKDWVPHEIEERRIGNLSVGICSHKGGKAVMQDAHLAMEFELNINNKIYSAKLFGIFDGHGYQGERVSHFLSEQLSSTLIECLRLHNRKQLSAEGIWSALKDAFPKLHEDLRLTGQGDSCGSTATVVLLLDGMIWTANVGDSRAVFNNNGEPMQLSEDAKPGNIRYKRYIEKRKGKVSSKNGVYRVNGDLAVARAIGNIYNPYINHKPKITAVPLTGNHLILCSDGVFDVAPTKAIVEAVHNSTDSAIIKAKKIVYSACEAGARDNLSALVVDLTPRDS